MPLSLVSQVQDSIQIESAILPLLQQRHIHGPSTNASNPTRPTKRGVSSFGLHIGKIGNPSSTSSERCHCIAVIRILGMP
jgi:hypothetical protein